MRILFVASEALPYAKTGGLADVLEALPRSVVKLGHNVAVFLPRYRGIETNSVMMESMTIPQGTRLRFPSIRSGSTHRGVRYFFLDDPGYFDRDGIYGDKNLDFPDNAERFTEFSRAAIELAKHIWRPDLIHCNDWQTSMVPVLLRTSYGDDPAVKEIPVVFTIHNMGYHGVFPRDALERAGIPAGVFHPGGIEFFGNVNFLKGGLVYSDYLTTVSRKYAQEIQTSEFGFGLEGVVRSRSDRLVGILNGVDYSSWSPERDKLIPMKYSAKNLDGKRACKMALLDEYKLSKDPNRPVVGIVSRFADQKGFDLIAQIAGQLVHEELSLAVLGTGERRYEDLFRALAKDFPGRVGAVVAYDNRLAHLVEAGSDMFLMPSRYEPCGLNQMYSMRYGTVPVVHAVGGLADTVEEFDVLSRRGTGFRFGGYEPDEMMGALRRALAIHRQPELWTALQRNGMGRDFSWRVSADGYERLYADARARVAAGRVPTLESVRAAI